MSYRRARAVVADPDGWPREVILEAARALRAHIDAGAPP